MKYKTIINKYIDERVEIYVESKTELVNINTNQKDSGDLANLFLIIL